MVKTEQGTYVPKQNKVVVLWDLDNKPPRGPPYDAALSLKTLAERFSELTDISAYANRPKSSTSSLRCHHHRSTILSSPSPTAISNNSPAHTFYLATPIAPNVSLARQNFNNDSEAAINEQINVEYNVSYVYHSLFAFFFTKITPL